MSTVSDKIKQNVQFSDCFCRKSYHIEIYLLYIQVKYIRKLNVDIGREGDLTCVVI